MKTRNLLPYLPDTIGTAVEIGVATGNYSRIIDKAGYKEFYLIDAWIAYKDQRGKLTDQAICDKWMDDVKKEFAHRKVIRNLSTEAVKMFKDNYFDFIYIDADHSYEAVKNDLDLWLPKCKIGGVFAGHDYGLAGTGVKKAVDEFANKNGIVINVTGGTFRIPPSWYFVRR